jgi:methionine-rich copper-binding protein CopC
MERMRLARFTAAALVAAVIAVLTAGPAWAHNSLTKAVPDKSSTVTQRPGQVELTFLQKVDPEFLTIGVTDAQQQAVPLETPKAKGKVGTVAFSEPLTNGVYTVTYQVVSLDGHEVKGSYKFTLNDPAATTPPPTAPTTAPAEATPSAQATLVAVKAVSDDGGGLWPIVAGIAAVLVLGGAAFFALRRRKIS